MTDTTTTATEPMLELAPTTEPASDTSCRQCGTTFKPRVGGKPQTFCTPECRRAFHDSNVGNVGERETLMTAPQNAPTGFRKPVEQEDTADDFDWHGDSVMLREQPRTAIYFNLDGDLVIRQRASYPDEEDPFIFIAKANQQTFLDALCDALGIGSTL
jgi:hypothetical protein